AVSASFTSSHVSAKSVRALLSKPNASILPAAASSAVFAISCDNTRISDAAVTWSFDKLACAVNSTKVTKAPIRDKAAPTARIAPNPPLPVLPPSPAKMPPSLDFIVLAPHPYFGLTEFTLRKTHNTNLLELLAKTLDLALIVTSLPPTNALLLFHSYQ